MSKIKPILIEYNLQIKNYTMKATAEHLELARKITFYFNDKIVSEKAVPPGDFLTDDDCIRELVENYCKNQVGVYADLFRSHSDKVHLVSKKLEFEIDYYGIKMNAKVTVEKEKYHISVSEDKGEDTFSGTFRAESFSEVLEKVRIFLTTLTEVSEGLSTHIDEFSNDKIEEWIKWED